MRGEIECKAPGLTSSSSTGIRSAENVAGPRVPARQARLEPERRQVSQHRITPARRHSGYLKGGLRRFGCPEPAPGDPTPKDDGSVVRMAATTRSRARSTNSAEVLQLDVVQRIRTDRILRAQNEEKWIVNLKAYLSGDLENLDAGEARACSKLADEYDVDDGGLLLYCPRAGRDDGDRDRLAKLVRFKTNEQRSKGASGVEESLHTVNIQSHYSDVDGLVRYFIELEQLHQNEKIAKKLSKQKKEADLAQCAKDIVAESNRRRADREAELSDSDVSDGGSYVSATDSSTSRGARAPKRTNAFLAKEKRQEKRYKEQMDMKVRELEQKQKQFDDRLAFEREQAQAKLQFDMEVQANNRNMILECAKIFSAALVNKD
ncbi:hypothetical protein PPTG_21460 [Phytophthora nicotianae INRA-310]|uniref:Uncharacterized protein n=1 Tax=Phytophthora nicotianae (strain INRA-310) TaxID=761204 RepID=W2R4K7_PHYN3|nr:hypothetical protein PPTG_21460 [Phytophthora nicotianae INRA-310]ETN19455.1 hypothetical protein PPTG_21460 [Phytophthora nicotianae INRA-310]